MDEWEQEGLNLRKKLRERLDQTREVEDQEIYRQIDDLILEETRNRYVSLRRKEALRTELFNSIRKLDILQELIDDDSVTEIMVNGTEGIFLERNGRLLCWEKKITSKEKLEDMVQQIAGRCNRIVNESVPVADARLSDGSRVSLVLPPVALNGPVITIRRFPKNPIHMDRLVELGAVTTEAAAFLRALVRSGYNIFISGEPALERPHFSMRFPILFRRRSGSSPSRTMRSFRSRGQKIWSGWRPDRPIRKGKIP